MSLVLRDAEAADVEGWLQLWQAYLQFYHKALPLAVTQTIWARIRAPDNPLNCRVAVVDGQIAGFAVWHTHAATWAVTETCYLEDLFVDAGRRGQGTGRALIDDLMVLARARGCHNLYWHTEADNRRARALYDHYGAADGLVRYRIGV